MSSAESHRAVPRRPSAPSLIVAQVGYQLRVLVRSPLGSFATLIVPLMVLLAVNLLYKDTRLPSRGDIPYTQFFTPAMIAFAVLNACYTSVISQVTLARDEGILKRIRCTPLPPWIYMTGRLCSTGLVAGVSAVVVVAVGAWVYDFEVIWAAVPAVLLTLAVGMFCFCAVALAVTVLVPRADAAFPVAWGTILPLCFISDVFIPMEGAPGWLRDVASFFPVRGFADDLETAFNPVHGSHALQAGHLELLAVWGVAAAAFALVAFRWEPGGGGGRREAGAPRAAFALERARSLFVERASQPPSALEGRALPRPVPEAGRREGPVPGHQPAVTATEVERIEGPAPAEDSSVPVEPA